MLFRGRTVALMVGLTIIISSVLTAMLTSDGLLEHQVSSYFNPTRAETDPVSEPEEKALPEAYEKLVKIQEVIESSYLGEAEEEELINGAIEGMLSSLDDPYTVYMDPEEAEQFNSTSIESTFEGIGAEVTMKNGRVTIGFSV